MSENTTSIETNDGPSPQSESGADINMVRREHALIVDLPEPDLVWAVRDLRESEQYPDVTGIAKRLEQANIINSDEREYRPKTNKRVKLYQTDRVAYERSHEYLDRIDTLPCCPEGTGFRNVGSDGDEPPYECQACGARHDRETVLESGVLS